MVVQEMELLSHLGQIAGIAGMALAIFFLIFRRIIIDTSGPQISPADKYKITRLVIVLTYRLAIFCLSVSMAGFIISMIVKVYTHTS